MITLQINAPCDALTSNQRLHHHARADLVRNWRLRTAILARRLPAVPHAHITCTLHFTDDRRRDAGNWYPTAKSAVDGLVDSGVLPDDSDTYVIGPDMRRGAKSTDRFRITLRVNPTCQCVDCAERFGKAAS